MLTEVLPGEEFASGAARDCNPKLAEVEYLRNHKIPFKRASRSERALKYDLQAHEARMAAYRAL